MGPLINFLLPLSFLTAFGFVVYGLVLFNHSVIDKSRTVRTKALKTIFPPLIYMITLPTIFYFKRR